MSAAKKYCTHSENVRGRAAVRIAILIPMISPVKIQLGPMSFTLGSHVAIFIAMFISPAVALTVELGATLGLPAGGLSTRGGAASAQPGGVCGHRRVPAGEKSPL